MTPPVRVRYALDLMTITASGRRPRDSRTPCAARSAARCSASSSRRPAVLAAASLALGAGLFPTAAFGQSDPSPAPPAQSPAPDAPRPADRAATPSGDVAPDHAATPDTTDPHLPPGTAAFDAGTTRWTVQIEPLAWWVSPSGDVRLPARSGTGGPSGGGFADSGDKVDFASLNLDTPRLSPTGELHVSGGRWRFTFSGGSFSLERDDTPSEDAFRIGSVNVAAGDPLNVDFTFTTAELSVGYCVWGRDFFNDSLESGRPGDRVTPFEARVYVLGGVRGYETDLSVRNLASGEEADFDGFFAEPILGTRIELEINEVFTVDAQVSVGYYGDSDKSSASLDIAAGFMYYPHPNVGIQIGWRQVAYNLTDGEGLDEFEYTGRVAGLYAGFVVRF